MLTETLTRKSEVLPLLETAPAVYDRCEPEVWKASAKALGPLAFFWLDLHAYYMGMLKLLGWKFWFDGLSPGSCSRTLL